MTTKAPSAEALAAARPLAGSGMVVDPEHAERLLQIAHALDTFADTRVQAVLDRLFDTDVIEAAVDASRTDRSRDYDRHIVGQALSGARRFLLSTPHKTETSTCPTCGGSGMVPSVSGNPLFKAKCLTCDGDGHVAAEVVIMKCPTCGGDEVVSADTGKRLSRHDSVGSVSGCPRCTETSESHKRACSCPCCGGICYGCECANCGCT